MSHCDPWAANKERFTGFADVYDSARPTPPPALLDVLCLICQAQRPGLVVDLGCGTGLSSRIWAGRAGNVVGVEPSADMRRQAQAATPNANVSYREGLSHQTGLDDGCADIVTASQSLHWMEPEGTFAEAGRILRPGGVFASVDCDFPPVMGNWQAEEAWHRLNARVNEIEKSRDLSVRVRRWGKDQHLQRMQASGQFRYCREILLHNREIGSADRLMTLALSLGSVQTVLKAGVSEDQAGLTEFRQTVRQALGQGRADWYFGYRVRAALA